MGGGRVPETFYFPFFPCVHKTLTERSSCAPITVQHSLILHSVNIIFRVITIHTCTLCYFFLIIDETQCKDSSQGTPNKLLIMRSQCSHIVHCALTVILPLDVRLRWLFAQSALAVRSAYAHRSLTSSGKVERYRDCKLCLFILQSKSRAIRDHIH